MTCLPNRDSPRDGAGHSPALAVVLDGRLIYGPYEGGGQRASDLAVGGLDACNGHFGPVPADAELGVPASCTYHYHTTANAPFTVGCFGPVGSLERCKSLYEGCGSGYDTFKYDAGNGRVEEIAYDNWCPCYQQASDTGVCAQTPGPTPPGPGPATPSPGTPEVPCTAALQNGADCASFLQYKRKKKVCKKAGCQWVKQGKGPARPPEGDSCGSPRAESSPGGPRALGKKVAPTFFLASFLSLKRG